jgi:hypothetical protein
MTIGSVDAEFSDGCCAWRKTGWMKERKMEVVTFKYRYVGSRRRWEDNIKVDLQEVECGGMDWVELAKDRDRWQAFVNAVMNLQVP